MSPAPRLFDNAKIGHMPANTYGSRLKYMRSHKKETNWFLELSYSLPPTSSYFLKLAFFEQRTIITQLKLEHKKNKKKPQNTYLQYLQNLQ